LAGQLDKAFEIVNEALESERPLSVVPLNSLLDVCVTAGNEMA
jgi:hypothetical protein